MAPHTHAATPGNRADTRRRLVIALLLLSVYLVAEIVGGLLTGSLALLADAGHMASDIAALALSLFALWIARRPATPRHSYGYYRAEILAALVNGATLLAVSAYVLVEAFDRLRSPHAVQGGLMFAVALGGLVVNLLALWVLAGDESASMNVRGAWLHVLGDALGSVAAILGAVLIWAFGWDWADPVASGLIGLLVVHSTWSLLKEAVAVLMEGAPGHLDPDAVRDALIAVPGVQAVHDLHIWTITSGLVALSAHVVTADGGSARALLQQLRAVLHDRFGIEHTTLQLEPADFGECKPC